MGFHHRDSRSGCIVRMFPLRGPGYRDTVQSRSGLHQPEYRCRRVAIIGRDSRLGMLGRAPTTAPYFKGDILMTVDKQVFIYRIDRDDHVVYVGDNWQDFADENGATAACSPDFVLGRSLWHFISDAETEHLYKILVERVRLRRSSIRVPIRCDSPGLRRFMEVEIHPLKDNGVEFRSSALRVEPRERVDLLRGDISRSEDLLRICSFCKKIDMSKNHWVETERAVKELDLFGPKALPSLTHGVCPSCYDSWAADLDLDTE
jgi:hypothetical protein